VRWRGNLRQGSGTLAPATGAFPELPLTFRARTESPDGKTSPEELIASAHAACYAMAFSNLLATEGSAPEELEIEAICALDRTESGLKITTMTLNVAGRVAGIDQARFQQLAEEGERRCPVSNALRGNVAISVSARLK
jgi:osmotically inducible protein OsmC